MKKHFFGTAKASYVAAPVTKGASSPADILLKYPESRRDFFLPQDPP